MADPTPTKSALRPTCGQLIDAVVAFDAADPAPAPAKAEPGDITFCFNCAAMLVFGDAAQPAAVTDAQKAELFDEMPQLRQAETLARDLASQIRRIRGPFPPRTNSD